jgi:hypothetical protein
MFKVITSLTDVMNMILKVDKSKEQLFKKQDYNDHKEKNGKKKMDNRLLAYRIPNIDNITMHIQL